MKRYLGTSSLLTLVVGGWICVPAAIADQTNSDACSVVQAAYMVVNNSQDLVFPEDANYSSRPRVALETFAQSYIVQMALQDGELADLVSQESKYPSRHFFPQCVWTGVPKPMTDGVHRMDVDFSDPIFSSDGRLAVIEISVHDTYGRRWGYGELCIVRKAEAVWSSRCLPSWIN